MRIKWPITVALILACASCFAADGDDPSVKIKVDMQHWKERFLIPVRQADTPLVRVYTSVDGEDWISTTNWAGLLGYGTNYEFSTNMVLVNSTESTTNYTDFQFTAADCNTNGEFFCQIIFTNKVTLRRYTFPEGRINIDRNPIGLAANPLVLVNLPTGQNHGNIAIYSTNTPGWIILAPGNYKDRLVVSTSGLPEWVAGGAAIAITNVLSGTNITLTKVGRLVRADLSDDELNAIAALASSANKGIYFTGSGLAATFDLSAWARTILDDADEATFKATVNLEPGVDVQAYSIHLDGWSLIPTNTIATTASVFAVAVNLIIESNRATQAEIAITNWIVIGFVATNAPGYTNATAHAESAHKLTADGGFQGGADASTEEGGAVGIRAFSDEGGASGFESEAQGGGASGRNSIVEEGGASGNRARTSDGFAGGLRAYCTSDGAESTNLIDAVQLGEGSNTNPRTLKVYGYYITEPNGNILFVRMSNMVDWVIEQGYSNATDWVEANSNSIAQLFSTTNGILVDKFVQVVAGGGMYRQGIQGDGIFFLLNEVQISAGGAEVVQFKGFSDRQTYFNRSGLDINFGWYGKNGLAYHYDAGSNTHVFAGSVQYDNYILIEPGTDTLYVAYSNAPAASSETNQYSIMCQSSDAGDGGYILTKLLVADKEWVHIVSETGLRDVFITGSNIAFNATNMTVRGLDVTETVEGYLRLGDNKPNQVFENCKGGDYPIGWWTGRTFAGMFDSGEGGAYFIMGGTNSGTVIDSVFNDDAFGSGILTASSLIEGCIISIVGGFGTGGITNYGTIRNSTLGSTFCASSGVQAGIVEGCTLGNGYCDNGIHSGTTRDSVIGLGAFDTSTQTGAVINCTFAGTYGAPSGAGYYWHCTDSSGVTFYSGAIGNFPAGALTNALTELAQYVSTELPFAGSSTQVVASGATVIISNMIFQVSTDGYTTSSSNVTAGATAAGISMVHLGGSWQVSGACLAHIHLYTNGVEVSRIGISEDATVVSSQAGNHYSGIIDLSSGTIVDMRISHDNGAARTFTFDHFGLMIEKKEP